MAYFANGSEGEPFDAQCGRCKYGEAPCPIAALQTEYNYDQNKPGNEMARKILDTLVMDDGTCTVFALMEKDLALPLVGPPSHPSMIDVMKAEALEKKLPHISLEDIERLPG